MLSGVTIVARRRAYWSLFAASCLCLAAFVVLFSRIAAPAAAGSAGAAFGKAGFRVLGAAIPVRVLAASGAGLCALYAAAALGLILWSFRTTVSSEIYFFAFWVLSIGLEVLRLLPLVLAEGGWSSSWQLAAARGLLAARYGGWFFLFASGLFASGFRSEKLGPATALAMALAVALGAAMPVNTGSFAPTLEMRPGYAGLNAVFVAVVSLVTVANYLYAANSSGEGSYRLASAGLAVALVGQRLVVTQWNPFLVVLGFALLSAGSWLVVSRLHVYYLWQ